LLVDVAIRALSPAINDPTTAIMALNQIDDLLRRLGRVNLDVGRATDRNGVLRLVYPVPRWEDLLELGLVEILYYGANSIQVMRRMAALLADLEETVTPEHRPTVGAFARRVHLSVERSFPDLANRQDASEADRQGLGLTSPSENEAAQLLGTNR
jgi:uncharacterized membrane protein